MTKCPCGSSLNYALCCGSYINGASIPATPEALMRSRYTAYVQANIDYIKQTMRGSPLIHFDASDAEIWAKRVTWLGLKVVQAYLSQTNPNKGYVEFIARFKENNQPGTIHELSEFDYENGSWFYTAGHEPEKISSKSLTKTPRNAPCPCGSQKKFKNCCSK
ncbi:YchJ family protein [Legionella hackeliae]|uniref:Putative SEC-C motif domain protein n=1 Tax=Legionella hackeliae TaxID=449 RepID=A0A0A8UR92_LEGHA|nr:YchJ family protein [Legionella hackeliae]KTD10523.1 putative SEC-C motif domain protein [Legionella hackeliae]CEK10026.1 putative SEC-C motif domain protein [Legionella hackeliae]STX46750.1 putative SEC-C motif domain protein [Legionella hackeliae]